jgi:hypothetical protein
MTETTLQANDSFFAWLADSGNGWCYACRQQPEPARAALLGIGHFDRGGLHVFTAPIRYPLPPLPGREDEVIERWRPGNNRLEVDGIQYEPEVFNYNNQPMVWWRDDYPIAARSRGGGGGETAARMQHDRPPSEDELDLWVKTGDLDGYGW